MDHIRRLLVDRHDGRGAVGGAVGTQKSAVAQNQRAQKRSVHRNGFLRFRHSIRPLYSKRGRDPQALPRLRASQVSATRSLNLI